MGRGAHLAVCALFSLAASNASAGSRLNNSDDFVHKISSMLLDYTNLDCTMNRVGSVFADAGFDFDQVGNLDDGAPVHIQGGKQFGPFVAYPNTDEEFDRTWLRIKSGRVKGWIPSGWVNCGG